MTTLTTSSGVTTDHAVKTGRTRSRPGVVRSAVMLLTVILAALSIEAVTARQASASVGCYGDYCSGKDPMATGCANDAVTVTGRDLGWAYLSLRW